MHSKGALRGELTKIAAAAKIFLEEVKSAIFSSYRWGDSASSSRIMFVAYAPVPTLQLSFLKPLAPLFKSSRLAAELLTDQQILVRFGGHRRQQVISSWIARRIARLCPNTIVFCRYSGRYAMEIIQLARSMGIRTIFHIDDDLLNVPVEIGKTKFEY
ncbi:MAG TPA: hypothetical protein VFM32_08035, partial [Spongiibacteraceae bacterium]|nr:hypothetical protein [Spongiibacteraceae bacterium]